MKPLCEAVSEQDVQPRLWPPRPIVLHWRQAGDSSLIISLWPEFETSQWCLHVGCNNCDGIPCTRYHVQFYKDARPTVQGVHAFVKHALVTWEMMPSHSHQSRSNDVLGFPFRNCSLPLLPVSRYYTFKLFFFFKVMIWSSLWYC